MKTKIVRIEQEEANTVELDEKINKEILKLEEQGFKVVDFKIAVGRDADVSSGLEKRFSVTVLIIYN